MMRSKTSCFNKTILIFDIKGLIPAVVVFTLLYMLLVCAPLFGQRDTETIRSMVTDVLHTLSSPSWIAVFSIVFSVYVFGYLYKRNSSYMLHALPVSRMAHFISHYVAGFVCLLAFTLICYAIVFAVGVVPYGASGILTSFVETLSELIFFYGLAVFVVNVCGSIFLSVVTYGVINLIWFFVNVFASLISYVFSYDPIITSQNNSLLMYNVFDGTEFLFPWLFFTKRVGAYSELSDMTGVVLMIIPGIVFSVLALLLYKSRKIEKTGEIVAFDWCKVVFRVIFTLCCSGMVSGWAFIPVANYSYSFVAGMAGKLLTILAMLVGGALGFVISEMILRKSVHIFKSGRIPWLQGIITMACLFVFVTLIYFDAFGQRRLPDKESVYCAEVSVLGENGSDSQTQIDDAEELSALMDRLNECASDKELLSYNEKVDREEVDQIGRMLHIRLMIRGKTTVGSMVLEIYLDSEHEQKYMSWMQSYLN